jgi:hypothetical protein
MFAFLKGKADIVLENYNFSAGDIIKGKVILKVKKNFESKGIVLKLLARSKKTSVGAKGSSTSYVDVYNFSQDLEREKSYSSSSSPLEIPFELKIPENVFSPNQTQQNIMNVVGFVTGNYSQINWSVNVKVRVRKCLTNITKKVSITVK